MSRKLILRGNEPFVTPVVYDANGPWEMKGMSRQEAVRLQNTTVALVGDVTRPNQVAHRCPRSGCARSRHSGSGRAGLNTRQAIVIYAR